MIIDLFADVACPWCWIGERRLKNALDEAGTLATVRWRPYCCSAARRPRASLGTSVETKFGGWERARPMFAQVAAAGAPEGLRYDFEAITRAPNTRAAHRVLLLAQDRSRLWETADALFSADFAEGRDVTEAAVLAEVAGAGAWTRRKSPRCWRGMTTRPRWTPRRSGRPLGDPRRADGRVRRALRRVGRAIARGVPHGHRPRSGRDGEAACTDRRRGHGPGSVGLQTRRAYLGRLRTGRILRGLPIAGLAGPIDPERLRPTG